MIFYYYYTEFNALSNSILTSLSSLYICKTELRVVTDYVVDDLIF